MTNLPIFTNGTDKQIAYASKIRDAVVVEIKTAARGHAASGITPEAMFEKHLGMLAAKASTDAVVWIKAFKAAESFFEANGGCRNYAQIAKAVMTK